MFNTGNMQQMIKQAQKLQEEVRRKQEELEQMEIEVSSGGGVVKIKFLGNKAPQQIKIDPKVVDADDVESLEDLILAAMKEGMQRVDELRKEIMGDFDKLGGMF